MLKPCDKDNVSLYDRQKYPLEIKIKITEARIREWYTHYNGQVDPLSKI